MNEREGVVTRGELEQAIEELKKGLITGDVPVLIPPPLTQNPAGGTNHYPNSDLSYSEAAVLVQGTLPATAGDDNQRAWRHFRQKTTDNILNDDAHSLKAVGHSTYAANEGVNTEIPVWDRVHGWIEIGAIEGADQYDIAAELLTNLVGPGDTWAILFRCAALDPADVPADLEVYFGFWEQRASSEGWITGGPFDLDFEIKGTPGTRNIDYRVLAETDSGIKILSNILNVPNAPDTLSSEDYVKVYHNAGAGFIVYRIYRKEGANYYHLFDVRNSTDLQYNDTDDTGTAHFVQPAGWPDDPGEDAPQAIAQTRGMAVGVYNGAWALNQLRVRVPSSYDFSQTVKQYLRFGFTVPTGVNRHIGIDRLWLSTTFNEWSPDQLQRFADGTYPVPSISPSSGFQGTGDSLGPPPDPGTGGRGDNGHLLPE